MLIKVVGTVGRVVQVGSFTQAFPFLSFQILQSCITPILTEIR